MSGLLFRIAERALNRPLFLHPDKAAIIHDVLSGRIGTDALSAPMPEGNRLTGDKTVGHGNQTGLYVRNGIPIVPIVGSLVNRGGWVGADSGLVSYEGIGAMVDRAVTEATQNTIALDIDSGGGEATGMMATADQIRAIRDSGVRVIAVVNDIAASAAYGLAAQASEVWVSPTSVTGSIGTVMLHLDRSGEMEQKGIAPTLIFAGAHKIDGHAYGPLPDNVRDDLRAEVNKFYDAFLASVAAGRGERLSAEQARATEARIFVGEEAIEAGLADRIGTLTDLTAGDQNQTAGSRKRRTEMSKETGASNAEDDTTIPKADHDAAVANARSEALAEGKREGRTAERERIKGIIDHENAEKRPKAALAFALESDLTIDAAGAAMGRMAEEASGEMSVEQAAAGEEIGASATASHTAGTKTGSDLVKASVDRINARNNGK